MKARPSNSFNQNEKIVAILFGILDILLLILFIFTLTSQLGVSSEVVSNLSKDFVENTNSSGQQNEMEEYVSTITFSYNTATTNTNTESEGNKYDGFLFPNSDTVLLTDEDIQINITNLETCQRAINEIFARHGYLFTKQENVDYFNSYDWYRTMDKEEDMDTVSSQFSTIEKENIKKLEQYRDSEGWS